MAEIMHHLRLVVYPIIYKVLYIPGGAGFLPSTVEMRFLLLSSEDSIFKPPRTKIGFFGAAVSSILSVWIMKKVIVLSIWISSSKTFAGTNS